MTEISDFQRGNLLKLADYLEKLPDDYRRFDMGGFHSEAGRPEKASNQCGAVACAVGHGPNAGISSDGGESWGDYSDRTLLRHGSNEWRWCFSGWWKWVDSTPKGASARIRWLLEKGIPENWRDQMRGKSPLCYPSAIRKTHD